MERCIRNGEIVDINDYLQPFEKEKEIRAASDNGELLCIEPDCLCRRLVYCHGQIREPYLRHKDNVECCYEEFEKRDTPRIKRIRDKLYELFKSKGYYVQQVVRFPTGRRYAHLLFDANGKKIVLQIADTTLNKRQCDAIVSECKRSGYLLNWIVIGDVNRAQDEVKNYHISRHAFNTSSDNTLIIINEDASIVTQTMSNSHTDDKCYGIFQVKGRPEQLILNENSFCIEGFARKYQQWKQRQLEEKQKRINSERNFGQPLNYNAEKNGKYFEIKALKKKIELNPRVFDKEINKFGIVTDYTGAFVTVKYDNGNRKICLLSDFQKGGKMELL